MGSIILESLFILRLVWNLQTRWEQKRRVLNAKVCGAPGNYCATKGVKLSLRPDKTFFAQTRLRSSAENL